MTSRMKVLSLQIACVFVLIALLCAAFLHAAWAQPAAPLPPVPTFSIALTTQDGSNINQICTFAMDNTALTLATKTAVGQFCLGLLDRVGKAQEAAKQEAAKAPQGSGAK